MFRVRSSKNLELRTSNRRPSRSSRFSGKSRESRESRANNEIRFTFNVSRPQVIEQRLLEEPGEELGEQTSFQ